MLQYSIVKRIEEICGEFDAMVLKVGLTFARLELAKVLAEAEKRTASECEIVVPKEEFDELVKLAINLREDIAISQYFGIANQMAAKIKMLSSGPASNLRNISPQASQ